ncbi:MAG: hypothetical protein GYA17_01795, partial [Chloroflexi bacterium]|nr:hypothetical protein [Chloroflexota bacterium]
GELEYLAGHPGVGLVYGDLEMIDAAGNFLWRSTYRDFDLVDLVRRAGWISQQGNLIRRDLLDRVGLLDTGLHFQMDLDLWIRAGLVSSFGYLPQAVARFRLHRDSKTLSKSYLAAQDVLTIYRRLFARPDLPPALRAVENEALSSAYLHAARGWFESDGVNEAARHLQRSVQLYPPQLLRRTFWGLFPSVLVARLAGGKQGGLYRALQHLVYGKTDR